MHMQIFKSIGEKMLVRVTRFLVNKGQKLSKLNYDKYENYVMIFTSVQMHMQNFNRGRNVEVVRVTRILESNIGQKLCNL